MKKKSPYGKGGLSEKKLKDHLCRWGKKTDLSNNK